MPQQTQNSPSWNVYLSHLLHIYKVIDRKYNVFRVLTNIVYQYELINQDSPSEMLRFVVTPVVDGLRKQPGFSLLQFSSKTKSGRSSMY